MDASQQELMELAWVICWIVIAVGFAVGLTELTSHIIKKREAKKRKFIDWEPKGATYRGSRK